MTHRAAEADPGFWNGAIGAAQVEPQRRKYRGAASAEGWDLGRGYPPKWGLGPAEGAVPLPRKLFNFLTQNVAFWRLLRQE